MHMPVPEPPAIVIRIEMPSVPYRETAAPIEHYDRYRKEKKRAR